MGVVWVFLMLCRQQFCVITDCVERYRAQASQVPIFWQQSKGVGVEMNTTVILVVSKEPLKCTKHYSPPNMKVTVGVGSTFFPDDDDVELTGQTRQGVGEAGYILRKINDMPTVGILSMW